MEQTLPRRRIWSFSAKIALGTLLVYLLAAYVVMPLAWRRYVHRHPALEYMPTVTHTASGIPGDPLNVALVGSEVQVKKLMAEAGWFLADSLGMRSDLKIAADTVLERPDDRAPVSNLYLFGRKEDLAFEQPAGDNPRKRHHVRFWRTDRMEAGRPVWIGSATYDERVGLSHTTGQITHHISADVDVERDHLFDDLKETHKLSGVDAIDDFHKMLSGRNGGGDPWHTDGRLFVGVIAASTWNLDNGDGAGYDSVL